ncbi:MAG: radical SAM family heme chaperone HemW [Lentisphaerae bacterium]|nr:radical SAM family heme chaperone HemW [Lentisphaerota bacterium]
MIKRLYIHVPFCASKCGYCAFYSLPLPEPDDIDSYLGKLEQDFISSSHLCGKLESVFIGGGTPTFLSAQNLKKLFSLIRSHFNISASAEISIECNPETLTSEKARIIADFANRVSLGIQSFNPGFRRILGRQGSVSTIEKAVTILTKNGVGNIGCDLIYAIPGQTPEDWQDDLEKAVALPLKHISAYSLTVEEGTRLAEENSKFEIQNLKFENKNNSNCKHLETNDRRPSASDCSLKMWNLAGTVLKKHGFHRYEISNYAKRGSECRHNLEIWYGGKYLGFGPAAASFDGKKRWTNVSDLQKWLGGTGPEIDLIPSEKRAREIFVMGLRTSQGWNKKYFLRRTGFDLNLWNADLAPLLDTRLLIETAENIKCTKKGLLLWNEVAESLI